MPPRYLHSAFYRNGEDIVFYDKEFHELAYQIAMGEHQYRFELSVLGWHLFFTTPNYELEVLLEYGPYRKGDGKIKTRKPTPKGAGFNMNN